MPTVEEPLPNPEGEIPIGMSCQQCRRPGEDVRLVNYPVLLTLFTFQFRLELNGRWCRLHRTLRLMLAGLITATLGWLGFPFCIIATPRTLLGLASGRGVHKGNNARMLRALAERREEQGDLEGAARAMEESFFFMDDVWGRQELRRLYGLAPETGRRASVAGLVLAPLGVLLAALALGNGIGLADYFWMKLVNQVRFPLLDVLLGWLVLSGLGVPAVLLLRELVRVVLSRENAPRPAYGLALGLGTGLLLGMGVLAGRGLGNFADALWVNPTRLPGTALLAAVEAGLTRGWLLELQRFIDRPDARVLIHAVYAELLLGYALFAGAFAARDIWRWKARLADVCQDLQPSRPNLAPGWVALGLAAAGVVLLSTGVPQQSRLDFVEARDAYNQGIKLEYAERYDEAAAWFDRAVTLDPYMAEAYEELAWVYYQKGDAPQAIHQSLRSIEVNPNRASVHYSLGNIYYSEEDNQNAFSEFEKAIVLNPGYYEAYIGSGWAAYAEGDLTRAELSFLKALDHNPKPYDAYLGLGKIYEDRGKTKQAIETYQKANQTDVTSSTADVYLGLAYLKTNELNKAVANLENAVVKDPSNRMARTYLVMSYLNAGRFEDAVRMGSDSVERFPKRAGLRALLATALYESGQKDAAGEQLTQAMAAADKSDLDSTLLVHALLRLGRFADAEAEAGQALVTHPDRGDFYIDLASARMNQGKFDSALDASSRAAVMGVPPVDVAVQRGRIYLAWGKIDESLALLQEAQQMDPNNAEVHTLLGRVYYEQSDLEEALRETQQALLLNNYNVDAYINLGFILLEAGNGAEAIKAAAQAASLSPNLDVPHYILGMGYLATGQDGAAFEELNRYLRQAQASAETESMRDQAEKALQSLRRVY